MLDFAILRTQMRSHRCNVICHLDLLANMASSRFITKSRMLKFVLWWMQRRKLCASRCRVWTGYKPWTNKCMNEYQRELYNKQRQKLATEPVAFLTFIKPHWDDSEKHEFLICNSNKNRPHFVDVPLQWWEDHFVDNAQRCDTNGTV